MYRKILLPLDGSDLAEAAVPHAIELAKATGASVLVTRVIDSEAQILAQTAPATIEPMPSGRVTAEIAREAVEGQRNAATETLDAARRRLEAAGVQVDGIIAEGSPGEALVEMVEREGCDLVVMATHGRTGWRRAVLGSIADHVVRNTPASAVLLVKPEREDD